MSSAEKDKTNPDHLALKKVALGTPSGLLAFGFGSGLSPLAPGTMGTLVAVPFIFILKALATPWFWVLLLLLFLLGIQLCNHVSKKLGVHDHGGIVWDEMLGYWFGCRTVLLNLQVPW